MRQDKDHIYCADQEEEDYAISTEDDSGAVIGGSQKHDDHESKADSSGAAEEATLSLNRSRSRSIKPTNSFGALVSQKWRKVGHKFCEWPGLYSVLLTVLLSYSLIYFETSPGAKIAQFSYSQITVCLLVICMVAKNVFIPSRATRFLENSKQSS
mmetsp:Transcript_5632/g.7509  ORF Transcript_5632/g.7509 Transcript_5632/m.7509 type:complete len:155 (+) Transcript_5632:363-827(+)